MTLKDCYAALGGDYEDVMGRLRGESLVGKFVLKFPADQSYALLLASLEAGNVQDAFRAAHTIKGMCQNLSFTRLADAASAMTEALRAGDLETGRALLDGVRREYERTVAAIRDFQAGQPA